MFGHKHRKPQIPVQFFYRGNKVRSRNRIQLCGGFVQQQYLRLHDHNGGKAQKLLLSAGKGAHIPLKPVLYAKIAGHFRNPAADGICGKTQVFQPKGQLMPNLIRYDLLLRPLHDKAYAAGAFPGRKRKKVLFSQPDHAGLLSLWCQFRFQQPQQCGFSAAGSAHKRNKLSFFQRKGQILQRILFLTGVSEGQIPDCKYFH